jgi:hypothetical protein
MEHGETVSDAPNPETSRSGGTLYGVGLGPGDPELMTLKAHRLISSARIVAYPAPDDGSELRPLHRGKRDPCRRARDPHCRPDARGTLSRAGRL